MAQLRQARHRRFARAYAMHAERALFPQDRAQQGAFRNDVTARAVDIYAERADALPDDASRFQELHRALVLASVRSAVSLGVARAHALKIIGQVYKDLSQTGARRQFQALLALAPNPLLVLQKRGTANALRRMMGQDMAAKDEVGADHYALVVEGCAYHDFFKRHGEPDATFVFCQADRAWMDVINRSKRALSISRPATQSTGAAACIFRYENAPPGRKPDIDVATPGHGAERI